MINLNFMGLSEKKSQFKLGALLGFAQAQHPGAQSLSRAALCTLLNVAISRCGAAEAIGNDEFQTAVVALLFQLPSHDKKKKCSLLRGREPSVEGADGSEKKSTTQLSEFFKMVFCKNSSEFVTTAMELIVNK